ncbi:MAG TPA: aminotransferase class V-fold PLP-dependent enzyme [Chitinophagaceae bacterium]|nr:aminotransferase class V-fold PLP-dependent enzyme [Chitinophagaceae bacterium]
MNKRSFLKRLAAAGLGAALPGIGHANDSLLTNELAAAPIHPGDDAWARIRKDYLLPSNFINLENGYYNIQPQPVLNGFIEHVKEVNLLGAYYMRTVQEDNKKKVAARLATLAGCNADELVITRNTTESLDMIIGGIHWKEGDEAVMALQDYGAMLEMFAQVAKRYGVVNRKVSLPNHPVNDEEIVQLYASALTPKTRLLMISHMVNITGQILPVQKICDMAHSKGVEVMVDGAHAFAHIQYRLPDLHCDYYGASLHKWLSTPLGAGILYVKKGKAENIWPLLAEGGTDLNDIVRLNHTGTHPVHTDLAINNAIDYYQQVGPAAKEERLRYLQNYWTSKLRDTPGILLNTPADPQRSCAIANVGVKGMPPAQLAADLMNRYHVYTVAIDYPEAKVQGCRITPNVFTTTAELDVLVKALQTMAAGK